LVYTEDFSDSLSLWTPLIKLVGPIPSTRHCFAIIVA
jgi:hypothetical protein